MGTHEFFPKYSWDWSKKIFISIFFWSHIYYSSNPWKIREISKHFNWGFIRKLPIIRETSSMLVSSLQESMQKWMKFQTICNLSLSILILKRYLQFAKLWIYYPDYSMILNNSLFVLKLMFLTSFDFNEPQFKI